MEFALKWCRCRYCRSATASAVNLKVPSFMEHKMEKSRSWDFIMCMFGNGERGVTLLHLRLIVFHFHLSPHHFDRRSFRSVGWSVSSSSCMLCHHIPSDCVCVCVSSYVRNARWCSHTFALCIYPLSHRDNVQCKPVVYVKNRKMNTKRFDKEAEN